jgi:hypothetical protein
MMAVEIRPVHSSEKWRFELAALAAASMSGRKANRTNRRSVVRTAGLDHSTAAAVILMI